MVETESLPNLCRKWSRSRGWWEKNRSRSRLKMNGARNTGQDRCMLEWMQHRIDTGQCGSKTGFMLERTEAVHDGESDTSQQQKNHTETSKFKSKFKENSKLNRTYLSLAFVQGPKWVTLERKKGRTARGTVLFQEVQNVTTIPCSWRDFELLGGELEYSCEGGGIGH